MADVQQQDMTGSGMTIARLGGCTVTWEITSLNSKSGCKFAYSLPSGRSGLMTVVRDQIRHHFSRGTFSARLKIEAPSQPVRVVVDRVYLKTLVDELTVQAEELGITKPTMDGLVNLQGVIKTESAVEEGDQADVLTDEAIGDLLPQTLAFLLSSRSEGGRALVKHISLLLEEMGQKLTLLKTSVSESAASIKVRMAEKMSETRDLYAGLDEERLYSEAARHFLRHGDVGEELERFRFHLDKASALLRDVKAAGQLLDLCGRGMEREVHTLLSKSEEEVMREQGGALELLVKQFREQLQNLE